MKVLLITDIFPPQIGGPASFIDRLAHELVRRGHCVTVVCASDTAMHPSDSARPFRVRRVALDRPVVFAMHVRLVLLREMLRHGCILVNGMEDVAAQVARKLRRRFVLKIVGDKVWETARNAGLTMLDIDTFQAQPAAPGVLSALAARREAALRQSSAVIVPSRYLQRLVSAWPGCQPGRVRVVLNGIHPPEQAQPARRADGPLEALYVGRLTNWKGVETLMLAVRQTTDVRLTMVGDGPEGPMLQALARQLGLEQVRFAGRCTAEQVDEHMRRSHLLGLLSLYEGLSHTLLEAQACGLPVVASHCGGNPEAVEDGRTGILVPPADPQAAAAALRRLADDEACRFEMASAAAEFAAGFAFERTVQQTIAVLEESVS